MPIKPRKSKGQAKTQARRVSKSGRKSYTPAKRMLSTFLYECEGQTKKEVAKKTDVTPAAVQRIASKAKFRANELRIPLLDITNFQDHNENVGRSKKLTKEEENEICDYVISSRDNRDKEASQHIADMKLDISESVFKQLMYDRGYSRRKHGWKTLLDTPTKGKRYSWALKYQHFDFKRRIVSTDEASIRKGERRGFLRTWSRSDEKFDNDVVQTKQSTYSDGQFWGSFAYDAKGPCHTFHEETKEEKYDARTDLAAENMIERPNKTAIFLATQALRELESQETGKKRKGKAPQLENYLKKEIKTRGDRSSGGVDWYRYRLMLKTKLLPFVKELDRAGRDPLVIEDGAASHKSKWNKKLYDQWGLHKLMDWPPRSPDLNPIEQAWWWCRRWIGQQKEIPLDREGMDALWTAAWDALHVELINGWIERIPRVIELIIEQKGDNDFHG